MTEEIKQSSIGSVIFHLVKDKFGGFTLWTRIEANVAVLCADLLEVTNEERKEKLIKGLKSLKQFLLDSDPDITESDLSFISEEIDRFENTKQITLYTEQEDRIEKEVIEKYARLSYGNEGIMGIHLAYNYEQLSKLTNGVYNKTGLVKFYISKEKTIYGKIIAEFYEYPQKIPIASLLETKKDDEGGRHFKKIALFGQFFPKDKYMKIKDIESSFYVYRFITEFNQDLVLLTLEPHEIGDYLVTGVTTYCSDNKAIGESAMLPTRLPVMFAQNVKNRIIKFKNHEEFLERLAYLKVCNKNCFDFPFTIRNKNKDLVKLKQPKWFKWFIWGWLTHSKKGLMNDYPLHVMIVGPPGSGKSTLLNALHFRSKESRDIFSGSSSKMKSLIPSFKYKPAKIGYLGESNRFAFCDELLRCIFSSRSMEDGPKEESVGLLNDLLEHQKREAGSGVSSIRVNMTSRVLATTNPLHGINCVDDLLKRMDESFLSRWLIYYQHDDDESVQTVKNSKDGELKMFEYQLNDDDWIAILDYLHTFSAEYDLSKLSEIKKECDPILSESLKKHYDTRHMHHLECLIDGVVKTRCFLDRDMKFVARDCDYEVVRTIWRNIIRSWIDPKFIKQLPVDKRIYYLPELSQIVYWKLVNFKKPMSNAELKEMSSSSNWEWNEVICSIVILRENGLILDSNGFIKPYYMGSDVEIESK